MSTHLSILESSLPHLHTLLSTHLITTTQLNKIISKRMTFMHRPQTLDRVLRMVWYECRVDEYVRRRYGRARHNRNTRDNNTSDKSNDNNTRDKSNNNNTSDKGNDNSTSDNNTRDKSNDNNTRDNITASNPFLDVIFKRSINKFKDERLFTMYVNHLLLDIPQQTDKKRSNSTGLFSSLNSYNNLKVFCLNYLKRNKSEYLTVLMANTFYKIGDVNKGRELFMTALRIKASGNGERSSGNASNTSKACDSDTSTSKVSVSNTSKVSVNNTSNTSTSKVSVNNTSTSKACDSNTSTSKACDVLSLMKKWEEKYFNKYGMKSSKEIIKALEKELQPK